jgi:hypothetical protein
MTVGTGTGGAATNSAAAAAGAMPPPPSPPPATRLRRLGRRSHKALSAGHGAGAAVAAVVVVGALLTGIALASNGGGSTPSANSGPAPVAIADPAPSSAAADPAADPAPDPAADPAPDPAPSAQCVFTTDNGNCTSSDPDVTLEEVNNGNTSACTFSVQVTWGDGSQQSVQFQGANGVPSIIASHTYQQQGTYSVSESSTVVSGNCYITGDDYTFTYSSGGS